MNLVAIVQGSAFLAGTPQLVFRSAILNTALGWMQVAVSRAFAFVHIWAVLLSATVLLRCTLFNDIPLPATGLWM
jgi:hypothetical protein